MKKKFTTKTQQILKDFSIFTICFDFNVRNISLDHYSNIVYSMIQNKLQPYLSFKDLVIITQEREQIVQNKNRASALRFFKKFVISITVKNRRKIVNE